MIGQTGQEPEIPLEEAEGNMHCYITPEPPPTLTSYCRHNDMQIHILGLIYFCPKMCMQQESQKKHF